MHPGFQLWPPRARSVPITVTRFDLAAGDAVTDHLVRFAMRDGRGEAACCQWGSVVALELDTRIDSLYLLGDVDKATDFMLCLAAIVNADQYGIAHGDLMRLAENAVKA